jgi:hypothetical protein
VQAHHLGDLGGRDVFGLPAVGVTDAVVEVDAAVGIPF